jgi:putative transcriptional regulator
MLPGRNRAMLLWFGASALLLLAGAALLPSPRKPAPLATNEIRPVRLVPVQSKNTKDLGPGKLLVASRDLGDENFAETVLLLVHYDEASVVGLILNRRTDVTVSRVFKALEAAKDRSDEVYLGGPVEEDGVFGLLQSRTKVENAEPVLGDVYMTSSKALLEKTIAAKTDSKVFHLYLGYAGWTNAQLQNEVEAGAWYVFQANAGIVFDSDPDSLWTRLIRRTEEKIAGNAGARRPPVILETAAR